MMPDPSSLCAINDFTYDERLRFAAGQRLAATAQDAATLPRATRAQSRRITAFRLGSLAKRLRAALPLRLPTLSARGR